MLYSYRFSRHKIVRVTVNQQQHPVLFEDRPLAQRNVHGFEVLPVFRRVSIRAFLDDERGVRWYDNFLFLTKNAVSFF